MRLRHTLHKITARALLEALKRPKAAGQRSYRTRGDLTEKLGAALAAIDAAELPKRPPIVSAPRQPIGALKPETRAEIERIMAVRGRLAR